VVSLPLLEAMDGGRVAAQEESPPMRFMAWFRPGGAVWDKWNVTGDDENFTISPTLAPLAPFKDRLLLFEGLNYGVTELGVGHPHYKGLAAFLTGSFVNPGEFTAPSSDPMSWAQNISIDQIIASQIAENTRYKSLELATMHNAPQGASPLRTISYDGPDQPRTPMFDPSAVYERLFSDESGDTEAARLAQLRKASILDAVREEYSAALPLVSGEDRVKLEEHLNQIREMETSLSVVCDGGPAPEETSASSDSFEQIGRLMVDLSVLAMSCDLTRVITLQYSEPLSRNSFPFLGLNEHHHMYQHDAGYQPETLAVIEHWYMEQFAYLLTRLSETTEGEGTLLDNIAILNGTELSHAGSHSLNNIPVLLAGGLGGRIRSGRVIRHGGQPYNNLLVSIQNAFGVMASEFGEPGYSTGQLAGFV
jgi:hypothetical protein